MGETMSAASCSSRPDSSNPLYRFTRVTLSDLDSLFRFSEIPFWAARQDNVTFLTCLLREDFDLNVFKHLGQVGGSWVRSSGVPRTWAADDGALLEGGVAGRGLYDVVSGVE